MLQPLIVLGGSSPRSLKRFLNHLRYIAMRCNPVVEPKTSWDRLRASLNTWFGDDTEPSTEPQPKAASPPQLPENVLVALAAIYRINEKWLDKLGGPEGLKIADLVFRECEERMPDASERGLVARRVQNALDTFNSEFGSTALFVDAQRDSDYRADFYAVMSRETGVQESHDSEQPATPPVSHASR